MQALPLTLIAAALAVIITVLSLMRGDSPLFAHVPRWFPRVWHFSVYAILAFLCVRALEPAVAAAAPRMLAGFLLATAFGALLEFLQKFSHGRSPRVSDALMNAAGAILGAAAALV